jgi:hypothetical protein
LWGWTCNHPVRRSCSHMETRGGSCEILLHMPVSLQICSLMERWIWQQNKFLGV